MFSKTSRRPRRPLSAFRKSQQRHSKEDNGVLPSSSGSVTSTDLSSQCYSFEDEVEVSAPLSPVVQYPPICPSIPTDNILSQRFHVQMSDEAWKLFPTRRQAKRSDDFIISTASLRFPADRDEIVLQDDRGRTRGVILPADSSFTAEGSLDYSMYALDPCHPNQTSISCSGLWTALYFYAHIYSKETIIDGCFHFTCHTVHGQELRAKDVMLSTLQHRAFCIQEASATATSKIAARVTCLTGSRRELLAYPKIDPWLLMSFLAVMEEVVLVRNL